MAIIQLHKTSTAIRPARLVPVTSPVRSVVPTNSKVIANARTAAAARLTVGQVPRTEAAGLSAAAPGFPPAEGTAVQPAAALASPDQGFGGALSSIGSLIQNLMGLTADAAATIQALGPQSGLQVEPVTFQSIEQEGRWKPQTLVADPSSTARVFELAGHAQNSSGGTPLLNEMYGKVVQYNATLFTISVKAPPGSSNSVVTVDATWWADKLEIWAGYAGMASASGFSSVYDDMASIRLHAIPYGNYYPAQILITWNGWVNPTGPAYVEFRGATAIGADGAVGTLAYMQQWGRGETLPPLTRDPKNGFTLETKSGLNIPIPIIAGP
jgi:hypothetical protein